MAPRRAKRAEFVLCIDNGEYDFDLVVGKVYGVVKPEPRDRPDDIRVLDVESALAASIRANYGLAVRAFLAFEGRSTATNQLRGYR